EALAANRRRNLARLRRRQPAILSHYGATMSAENLADEDLLALFADADLVNDSPLEVAKSLTFSHPQLATRNADTAAVVMDDHIDTADELLAFATVISSLGPATEQGGWAKISPSIDQNGQPLKWGPGYEAEDHPEGSTVYYYDLNNKIAGTADEPPGDSSGLGTVNQALKTSQNDMRLENQSWSVLQGTPDVRQSSDATANRFAAFKAAAPEAGEFTFTLNNRTPGYGLNVPKESIDFVPDGTDPRKGQFSIDAKNTFLRTLSSYVQFLDSQGKAIDNPPGWNERLPGFLQGIFESPSTKYISSVTAVNVILGIPMPTDPIELAYPWPGEAASCQLMFGGIGTRNWNGTVDPMGILLTGIFQYGVPMLFMLGGAAITSTAWFKDFVSKTDNIVAALGVAFPIVGGGVATAAALTNTKRVLFSFAGAIAGIIVGKGLEKLAAYIIAKLTAAQIANAVPIVGFAFRMAQMAITFANLAETTIEVAISPATYTVEVRRQLALELTMSPDPLHGTPTQPAVWPKVATNYVATVQYRNGTNFTVTGDLPTDPSKRDQPVVVSFPELPGGGQFQVVFGVYSSTQWLAGNWASSWVDAVAPSGSGGVLKMQGQIQELLVPLSPDTQYLYDSKLTYDAGAGRHVWHKGDQPTAVITDLNGGSTGHNLAQLVNITLNDKAYMLGYCWQASGQHLPFCGTSDPTDGQIYAFQNISTLANPQAALKFPSCGFSAQPYLVYDQFGPAPLFSLDSTFQSGLDQGKITPELRAAFTANQYALPENATVQVKQSTVRWLIFTGLTDPTYDLRREPTGRISVFSYPTPVFSPNNFYVDPRSGLYHLRRVVLDDKTPFDMNPGKSYGYFTEAHLDSIVVHPAGYVVGVNFKNSKMEIIQIPAESVADDKAQPASMVSGVGIRQGLMNGPIAIAVTSDGRLLVLEGLNKRVQAFDLNGNPVASFDGGNLTKLDGGLAGSLDQGLATMPLREAFKAAGAVLSSHWMITDGPNQYDIQLDSTGQLNLQQNGADLSSEWLIRDAGGSYPVKAETNRLAVQVQPPFDMPLEYRSLLDRGGVTEEIVASFAAHGITLAMQANVGGNGLHVPASYQVDLARGVISADLKAAFATRGVTITDQAVLTSRVVVRVQTPGGLWVIDDTDATQSYRVSRDANDPTKLQAIYWNPTMKLHVPDPLEKVTYLDLAVEMQGFIYVLSYTGEGKVVDDYKLDLYDPLGNWLSRTPDKAKNPNAKGVNSARLIVDMWRSMYTLNFEKFLGPNDRTEPSVSTWLPTTP
ncbi:MAG TPA: hypothetical protein VGX68_11480, partial [Thermoanaerobaculia bacterium]|nr:hypothetical protein [Thermoanaerobaculia bacterium]